MGELRVKYLEMLQAVIARMASNELTCRTWSVGLGTAVIGYAAAKDGHPKAALLAALPAVVFWVLDAYYVALERNFRDIFSNASRAKDNDPDFSFAAHVNPSDWFRAGRRPAVWLVHLPVLALAILTGVAA
jgi:hypothetical protein